MDAQLEELKRLCAATADRAGDRWSTLKPCLERSGILPCFTDYIDAVPPAVVADLLAQLDAAKKDAELLRSLIDENNPIDTIYFDDGKILDVGGKFSGDLRAAIQGEKNE
jgi:hypothetical protein